MLHLTEIERLHLKYFLETFKWSLKAIKKDKISPSFQGMNLRDLITQIKVDITPNKKVFEFSLGVVWGLYNDAVESWPDYSGNYHYPVPCPYAPINKQQTVAQLAEEYAKQQQLSNMCWSSLYGKKQFDLAEHFIKTVKAALKS